MKKLTIYSAILATAAMVLVSCKPQSTLQKDIKHMGIRFKPLSRNDLTLVGNLQAEITITGKGVDPQKVLDKSFASNLKVGLINKSEATEILYFAPAAGEAITGSLYESEIFNSVFGTTNLASGTVRARNVMFPGIRNFMMKLRPAPKDYGMQFGYYALVEKYPDVDYFINVRFDRKTVYSGKRFTETVIVKADGVKLKTD